ncbi:hypothetical protein JAAARDRAFT_711869 [Jaapia argillacea MUCL 33604]|uniref:Uncharacterized protein n=1 Tax=Jaapia argillacea MUCL 33604 TaxID=933084 RepID=A0A067PZA9_9AGAM|nr:hypothetical protein JAAARDRAFT_711869 [Jaapia argillacea MUCL 33604]
MVAQTRGGGGGGQPSPKKLKFNEKLVGKGLSTDVLLKKLKTLHVELAQLDQELVDVQSLAGARKELVSTSILLHKDRGVKAYAACCLADILRLYAPDAPYTQAELRDIFQFFFRQLTTGLQGADCSYYSEYFHLLESLSTVKSVVLVCDLPEAEDLMSDVFRDFFGIVRRDLPKKIEMFMGDILVALIDECQNLPSEVLEAIMAQFMDKNTIMEQPAYRLAVQICNATADKLQRHVCQYFSDIIISHSQDEEYDEIRTAHDLIKKLNRSCPSLLHNVVPQLEEELRIEDVQIRVMATQVLGEMFADKGGGVLMKKYPSTWATWLGRKNDRVSAVRLAFVESTRGLLAKPEEIRKEIEAALEAKVMDPDEKIRAAVSKVYSQIDYETALHHVSERQLRLLAARGADKRQSVRVEALNAVGRLYSLAYMEIENNDPDAIRHFSWIPLVIIPLAKVNWEVRNVIEQVITDHILPLPSPPSTSASSKALDIDESAWVDRLLTTMKLLDEKAIELLLSMSGLKQVRPTIYEKFLQSCIDNNGGVIDENEEVITKTLGATIQRIATQFPDSQKAAEDLHAFAKLNEGRLYKLLKTCLDTQTDLKNLVKATNDFLRRAEQSSSAIVPTLSILIRRASLRIVNHSSIPTLVRRIQKGHRPTNDNEPSDEPPSRGEVTANNAFLLLTFISKHCPQLYKPHIGELTKAIADEKNGMLVEATLQALAAVVKWDEKLCPNDKRTPERLMRFVLQSNRRHAKFAARLLTFCKDHDQLCEDVINNIADNLAEADEETLVAHVTVLAELARFAPDAFEQRSDVVMAFVLKQVIMVPIPPEHQQDITSEGEWYPDSQVPALLKAKIICLKICRNRCLAHSSSESAVDISAPVIKMLTTLLRNEGSVQADHHGEEKKVRSRMRLYAANSLLHLSSVTVYQPAILPDFVTLVLTIQDPCFDVRFNFLKKLSSLLMARKLPPRFNVTPFLTVFDPDVAVISLAKSYVSWATRSLPPAARLEHIELIFIRFLHTLAHHPDFSPDIVMDVEHCQELSRYVEFYLDCVASSENISLLYHLAMKLKTVRDAESSAISERLYIVSEVAQEVIKLRASSRSWNLQSYPGKIKLPSDILRPLPSAETTNKILKTVYLPENAVAHFADLSSKSAPQPKVWMNACQTILSIHHPYIRSEKLTPNPTGSQSTPPSTLTHLLS